MQSEFAKVVREQIDLAISGILLKHEIDQALKTRDRDKFLNYVQSYKQVRDSCLMEF